MNDELKDEMINEESEAERESVNTPAEAPEGPVYAEEPAREQKPEPAIEDIGAGPEETVKPEPPRPEQSEPEKKPETVRVYQAPPQQSQYTPYYYQPQEKTEKKRSNGVLIAVLAAITALSIIFAGCALVMGIMLSRNSSGSNKDLTDSGSSVTDRNENRVPSETEKNSGKTDDKQHGAADTDKTEVTDKAAPSAATDPAAVVQLGDSKTKYQLTEVAAMTVNSVVEIRTEQVVSGSFMQQYVSKGAGSGVIVTKDGYIATNNHVIDGATSITVTLRSGEIYDAVLIGTDSVTDIAVVKIDAKDLTPASFGSSDKLVVAESVIAIGNPLGSLGGSVTEGIISALARNVTIDNQEMTLMQTTAAINPGNSGGGLFNMSGECIGIVNAKSAGEDIEGIGFAIPSDTAVPVIEDLIRYGYIRGRVMLGVTMLEVNDSYTARRYGLSEFGVYIASIGSGSDAEKAGMKKNDRIVSINGKEITAYNDVKKIIQNLHPGDTAEIVVRRDGENVTLRVTFTEYIPSGK